MVKKWNITTIGDFLNFKNGLNKGKEFFGHGTPIVNYTDVYNHRGLRKSDIKGTVSLSDDEIARYEVKKGDVFFTRTSEIPDEVGLTSVLLDEIDDCVFSGFVLRGRPKNNMFLPEYCQYCFSTREIREKIILNCTYTTRALTNGTQLSKIALPVPTYKEQEAIAKVLSDIDSLINSLSRQIDKDKNMKFAYLSHMFPRNGTKVPEIRLPGFKGDWSIRKLSELYITDCSGGTPTVTNPSYYNGSIPFLGISDIKGRWIKRTAKSITELGLKNSSATIVDAGSIALAMYASVGKVGIMSVPMATSQAFFNMTFDDVVTRDFIYTRLQRAEVSNEWEPLISTGTQRNLNAQKLRKYELLVPEREEQKAIADFFQEVDDTIELHVQKLEKYKMIKQGMMEELLTGRVRLV